MIHRVGLGIVCALGAASFYGMVPNVTRAAFVNGVPPVESTFFRTSVIAIALIILAILRNESLRVPRAAYGSFLAQTLATLIISVGYLASVQFIPVGLAAIILYTFPVLIMLLAPVVEGHAPGILRTLIAVFAFAGLAVAVAPSFDRLDVRGILLAGGAASFCCVQFFSGRSISRHMAPAAFGGLVHLAIWPATLLVAIFAGDGAIHFFPGGTANSTGILFLIGGGIVYVGGYLIHMLSLRFAPASIVAPYFNIEPIMAAVVAALLLGERMAFNQYVGGAMVLVALAASSLIGRKAKSPS